MIAPEVSKASGVSISDVAHSRYWKLLLHYKGLKSESDGPEFFISPKGSTDPEAEMNADILAFQDLKAKPIGNLKQHPQCAFPERFRFVREQTGLSFPVMECRDFVTWREHFKPRSVTIIYAAPYLGSPASMFGHTFLRIDMSEMALLDYGISFEAVTGNDPGFEYALKGLLGRYPGMFSQLSYYLKVNTYTNIDSRDLWEYELSLTPEQIGRMLNHVWEMGTTYFNYYFFNKNCSYHLLSLLEVANPDWDLRSQFGIMAIPLDTIRAVARYPGAIKSVKSRSSILKILDEELSRMTGENKSRFYKVAHDYSLLTDHEDADVLDALLDWEKYNALNKGKSFDEAQSKMTRRLLVLRSKAKNNPESLDPSESQSGDLDPVKGHKSSMLSIYGGNDDTGGVLGVEFRPVLHDPLDPEQGFIPYAGLILAQMDLSYRFDVKKIRLDEFKLAEVINLSPMTRLKKSLSWIIGVRAYRPEDLPCYDCIAGEAYGGLGGGVEVIHDKALMYGMGKLALDYSHAFGDFYHVDYRIGPSAELGLLGRWTTHFRSQITFEKVWQFPYADQNLGEFYRASAAVAYSFLPFEVRLKSHWDLWTFQTIQSTTASVGWYF